MHCIRCKGEMKKNSLKGILIDYCGICNAVWLDQGELESLEKGMKKDLVELKEEKQQEIAEESSRPITILTECPKCQEGSIIERKMDGVTLDYCPNCRGLYFDHGELEQTLNNRKEGFFTRLFNEIFG